MTNQEINSRMISIEEKIDILEHNLDMPFGGRRDRANNSDSQIKRQIDALDNAWDDLALQFSKQ
tara:strand:- start:215 stop:406 length:192 start_codon:yes stop_codon:yes gene_type:complete